MHHFHHQILPYMMVPSLEFLRIEILQNTPFEEPPTIGIDKSHIYKSSSSLHSEGSLVVITLLLHFE